MNSSAILRILSSMKKVIYNSNHHRDSSQDQNEWDNQIVPRIKLNEVELRGGKMRNTQREIARLSRRRGERNPYRELTIFLQRSLQLSYIEPWFQFFLPPRLKGQLFVCTIGRKYWVIGARRGEFGSAFQFYQQEIRQSLQNHLNNIGRKRWKIPPFRVKVMPENPHEKRFHHELEELMKVTSVPMKSKEEKRKERSIVALKEKEQKQKPPANNVSATLQSILEDLEKHESRRGPYR